ncbi:histidine phosphatase family protein [Jongsikchunia kroppenstedtii]|uniref:histidine phosphatase family protein n=1 Tax=Jongsikchunia kroppenstedtii TaxID=1121721 RepID=UPI00036FDA9D|nr:histidine phosphatase family protein [Jongsikchunia kroppenstedtii]
MSGKLILVRHGETTSNVIKRLDTALPGASLTDFGARQAVRFGLERRLMSPAALYSSVARRARQTADLIGSTWGIDADVVHGVHEVQVGPSLEDANDRDAHAAFGEVIRKWVEGDVEARLPGGESLSDVHARYLPVIDELAERHLVGSSGAEVYLVSHGAVMRMIASRLTGLTMDFGERERLSNTGTIELEYADDGSWNCLVWGNLTPPFEPATDIEETPAEEIDPMG